MRRFDMRLAWGLLLVVAGVLLLLQNFEVLKASLDLVWAGLLGLAGLFFIFVFASNRMNWWALIPGIILLSVATLVFLGLTQPALASDWGGAVVLGGIGLSFWAVYLAHRENWWAIIPGGVLLTLAAVAGLENYSARLERRFETGSVFLIGLGLTFVLVGVLPNPRGRMRWAFIPAAILLVTGLLIFAAAEELLRFLGPLAIILFGLWLLYRYFVPRREM